MSGRPTTRRLDPDRLAAVAALVEPPEGVDAPGATAALERINRLAAALVGAPVSLTSLVTEDSQVFASQVGVDGPWQDGTPLTHSFCQHVVEDDAPLVVSDARTDARLAENLAIGDLGVIAYCGVPMRTHAGEVVGSFCVIDGEPRVWTDQELELVRDLASLAANELLRRSDGVVGDPELVAEIRRAETREK